MKLNEIVRVDDDSDNKEEVDDWSKVRKYFELLKNK